MPKTTTEKITQSIKTTTENIPTSSTISTTTEIKTTPLDTYEEESKENITTKYAITKQVTTKTTTTEKNVFSSETSPEVKAENVQYTEETDKIEESDFLENSASITDNENIYKTSHGHNDKIKLKNTGPFTAWWYQTTCKSGNCERPITWQTTRRRRHRYND